MGFFSFLGTKKASSPKQIRGLLPSLHSFVDVTVRNGGPKGSVCFENAGLKTFITSVLPGMSPGQLVSFNYQTNAGKYRFNTAVKAVDAKQATYDIPDKIETLQKFSGSAQRTNVRIDTTVPIQWRYSSAGRIESEWQKGILSDISRAGSSLSTDKTIKSGNILELKIPLAVKGNPTVLKADAKRIDKIEGTSKFTVGLAFHPLRPDDEKAIIEFINRRQVDLRNRGLA